MHSTSILNAFSADTIVLEYQDVNISVDPERIFTGESGVFMYKESLISRFQNYNEDPYLTLLFFKDNKLLVKMQVYALEDETVYTGKINDTPMVIKWNGYKLKYHDKFYENIEDVLRHTD